MSRYRQQSIALIAVVLMLSFVVQCAAEPSRANVVLIMTDDQGYGDLSCHGNPVYRREPHEAVLSLSGVLTGDSGENAVIF